MHSKFAHWCLAGFIFILGAGALAALSIPMYSKHDKSGFSEMIKWVWRLLIATGLLWWLVGLVFRFCSNGKYASGDTMPKSKSQEQWL